jgi:hypothetical protein
MADIEALLKTLWMGINTWMGEHWIDNGIQEFKAHPDAPFSDTGAALERLLALGASRRDLSLLCRNAAYLATFGTLIDVQESRITIEELLGLHECLLGSDPSGMEGRPGSAPPPQSGP